MPKAAASKSEPSASRSKLIPNEEYFKPITETKPELRLKCEKQNFVLGLIAAASFCVTYFLLRD
jgi:hypothetical protein